MRRLTVCSRRSIATMSIAPWSCRLSASTASTADAPWQQQRRRRTAGPCRRDRHVRRRSCGVARRPCPRSARCAECACSVWVRGTALVGRRAGRSRMGPGERARPHVVPTVFAAQLTNVFELAARHPDVPVALDHCGFVDAADARRDGAALGAGRYAVGVTQGLVVRACRGSGERRPCRLRRRAGRGVRRGSSVLGL